MTQLTCSLCGHSGDDVRTGLVAWREVIDKPFDVVARCVDRATCRERVELVGDVWPLYERGEKPPRVPA